AHPPGATLNLQKQRPMTTETTPPITTPAADAASPSITTTPYEQFIALLGQFSSATQRLALINLRIDRRVLQESEKIRDSFTAVSTELAKLEEQIETLCRANPLWFADSKTLKTPFGSAAMTKVTDLVVPDKDNTLR